MENEDKCMTDRVPYVPKRITLVITIFYRHYERSHSVWFLFYFVNNM